MKLIYKETNIFYTDTGKGSTVVLLHGFLENASMWEGIAKELAKNNRVITLDLLGHGQTKPMGYITSMETLAAVVNAVVKRLRLRRITLIGHSLGGYVALAYAEKHPQKIKALCLMNSTSQEDSEDRKKIRTRANKMVRNNFTSMVKISITNLFSPDNLIRFANEISEVKKQALQTSLQGYIATNEGMKIRPNREHVLINSSFKKLMIIGKKDPIQNFNSIVDECKRTQTETIIFLGGHMSHIENREELIIVLKEFVK